ncbi:transglycosylase SLT domain-containing protein [Actinomyces marmotae]|uniref:Transglycosylase SLT domain-containing protein n=1 Tax=Actinomyces marmotae TaxID=2737173 RepID=A0A6M8B4Y8_9ACTO|nr:transglycosylase SLT domain-containing protein [Actinomyces marmotae]QKD79156.1 transglycosylase SLT domain-containing protein [Actinomyces marmotae]
MNLLRPISALGSATLLAGLALTAPAALASPVDAAPAVAPAAQAAVAPADGSANGGDTAGSIGWVMSRAGSWSYINPADGQAITGWLHTGGSWFYLDDDGALVTGWAVVGGAWYYFNAEGRMATDWSWIDGAWYFLGDKGAMAVGWNLIGGSWYYLADNGQAAMGWLHKGGSWYFLGSSGRMAVGWASHLGSWYYFNGSGQMLTGWIVDGSTWYHLDPSSGRMTASEPVAGAAGSSGTSAAEAKTYASGQMSAWGWDSNEYSCLVSLWDRESGWNYQARSASGAYGIPQALPGSKMASAGSDWATNPATQITWGLGYIQGRYGSPCAAWSHFESTGWY